MEEALIRRIQPHSIEAEQSVVGAMLMDRDAIVTAVEIIHADDFYDRRFGTVFEAMVELYTEGKAVDLVTLQERLREKKAPPEIGSVEFLRELIAGVSISANARQYALIVYEKAMLRRLIRAGEEIADECYAASEPLDTILEETEKKIFELL